MTIFFFPVTIEIETHYHFGVNMETRTDKLTSLAELGTGNQATILAFSEGLCEKTKQRLEDLGLHVNRRIQCLRHLPFRGPLSIAIDGLVLAIESDIAQQILVSEQNL